MKYQLRVAGLLIGLAALLATGCATTEMETARQLESGELVGAGSLAFPGTAGVIPRMSGNVRYGFGAGDVGAHLGTSFFLVNIGAGARVYPSEFFTVGVQGDVLTPLFETDNDEPTTGVLLTVTPRILTTAQEGRPVYGGVEASIPINLVGADQQHFYSGIDGQAEPWVTPVAGPVVGLDILASPESGVGFQSELSFKPVRLNPDWRRSLEPEEPAPVIQWSIGMYYRPTAQAEEEALEPTQTGEPVDQRPPQSQPESEPPPQSEPEREPEPEPEYDEEGVPVY